MLRLVFLFIAVTLSMFATWSGTQIPVTYLTALFFTLILTTIGGPLSTIGIAKSGLAVEPADGAYC
ncbi:MAG: hypothetical protein ACTHKD_06135 [Devosia sp.]